MEKGFAFIDKNMSNDTCENNQLAHNKVFKNENGVEVEFKIKAKCSTFEEMRKALSFMAQSSHNFYLETAEKINSML